MRFVRISTSNGYRPLHHIYEGPGRLRVSQSNQQITVYFYLQILAFLTSCCSSFVSTVFEGVLIGLPISGLLTPLASAGPSRASGPRFSQRSLKDWSPVRHWSCQAVRLVGIEILASEDRLRSAHANAFLLDQICVNTVASSQHDSTRPWPEIYKTFL